jgi:hypothetical protein
MHFDHLIENILQGLATGKTEQQIADKHGVSVEQVMKQLEKGINVEMEHTKCSKIARKIAMDHLWERPDYYTKLKQIEKN